MLKFTPRERVNVARLLNASRRRSSSYRRPCTPRTEPSTTTCSKIFGTDRLSWWRRDPQYTDWRRRWMQVTLPLDLRPAPVTLEFDKEPDLGETAPKAQELLKASAWTWFRRAMVYSAEASKRLCGRNRKVPQDYQRAVVPDTVLFLHVFSLFCRVKCPSLSWSWQAMPHPLNEPWCLTSWVRCPLNAASSVTICLSARCILRGAR